MRSCCCGTFIPLVVLQNQGKHRQKNLLSVFANYCRQELTSSEQISVANFPEAPLKEENFTQDTKKTLKKSQNKGKSLQLSVPELPSCISCPRFSLQNVPWVPESGILSSTEHEEWRKARKAPFHPELCHRRLSIPAAPGMALVPSHGHHPSCQLGCKGWHL